MRGIYFSNLHIVTIFHAFHQLAYGFYLLMWLFKTYKYVSFFKWWSASGIYRESWIQESRICVRYLTVIRGFLWPKCKQCVMLMSLSPSVWTSSPDSFNNCTSRELNSTRFRFKIDCRWYLRCTIYCRIAFTKSLIIISVLVLESCVWINLLFWHLVFLLIDWLG